MKILRCERQNYIESLIYHFVRQTHLLPTNLLTLTIRKRPPW